MPSDVLRGDDPVAAALALLELRDECLRTASLLCLENVVQPGSAAAETDRRLIVLLQQGGEPPTSVVLTATLIERLGDTALVELAPTDAAASAPETAPASLLLMKGEAGWRVRALELKAEAISGLRATPAPTPVSGVG